MPAMHLAAYLAGAVLLALTLSGAGLTALVVVRRRLGHLTGAPRGLAAALLALTAVFVVHLLPLATGTLTRATPPLLSLLLAGLLWRLLPAVDPATDPATATPDGSPAAASGSSAARPASWALALAALAVTAVAAAGEVRAYSLQELQIIDTVAAHLPIVARWIQGGSLWHISQFIPFQWQGNFPNTGDVFALAVMLPWHSDFAVRFLDPVFIAALVIAIYALAHELGAPRPAALLFACVIAALPTMVAAGYGAELPDPVMYATFATGLLFLARFVRTRLRSDLLLAGVGLGLCFGVEWYSLTSVAVVLLVWFAGEALARLATVRDRRGDRDLADAARDGAFPGDSPSSPSPSPSPLSWGGIARTALLLGGLILLLGGVWLVRNWALSGDPFFPTSVQILGLHVFSAPPDIWLAQGGYTIFDYFGAGQGHVWATYLLPSFHIAFADAGAVLLGGLVLTGLLLAWRGATRRAGDPRVLAMGVIALGCLLAYFATPYSALGPKGYPAGTYLLARYGVPALIAAAPVCAWAAGRLGDLGVLVELAGAFAVFSGLTRGFTNASTHDLAVGAAVLALLAAASMALPALRRRPWPRLAVAGLLALGVLVAGHHDERVFFADRYLDVDPTFAAIARDPQPLRVAITGFSNENVLVSPILPSFGPRLANDVQYVGPWVDHELVQYTREGPFVAALRRGDFDDVILGRAAIPGQPVTPPTWVLAAGYRPALASPEFFLFTR